jgi:hypothetical protein
MRVEDLIVVYEGCYDSFQAGLEAERHKKEKRNRDRRKYCKGKRRRNR